jgi:hypothetical protein
MKRNAIPSRDEDFILDPRPWTDGTVLEGHDADGFFHVTTNRHRVFEDGRLRSRQDVGAVGLGGGHIDRGHHVSFVTNWSRAMWLYESMRRLREELEPAGTAVGVLKLALEWSGFPDDFAWQNLHDRLESDAEMGWTTTEKSLKRIFFYVVGGDEGDLDHAFDELPLLETSREWLQAIDANADAINDAYPSPAARYSLVQLFEGYARTFLPDDSRTDEPNTCVPTVGFTAPFERFMKIDPKQMSITQVAVRRGAHPADLIPEECELRFKPEDVQLVAVDCQDRANVVPVEDDEE